MATVRKRGNTYQIRVSCGYDITGKQIEKSITWKPAPNMTKKQIEKELERQKVLFEEKVQTGQFLDGKITLASFSERWFEDYAKTQLKTRTADSYKKMMPRILQALGHIRLEKLQPHHLMEFYKNLSENGTREDIRYKPVDNFSDIVKQSGYTQKSLVTHSGISDNTLRQCIKGRNVSRATADKLAAVLNSKDLFFPVNSENTLADTTIVKYHRLLSSILTTAVQWQIIPSNPCNRVKPPHVEYKEAPVLDEMQLQELINCLNNEPLKYKTAIMLVLYTGMRRGEVCGLNWEDVNFEQGIVHITKALLYTPDSGVFEDTPKSKQSQRVVNIPDDMVQLLDVYRVEQLKQQLSLGDQWQDSGKIFTTAFGAAMHPDTFSSWFKKFIRRHNLPDIHFHTLRHVSATLLIAGGVDVATVSKRLGHSNKTTTLNIYTHAIKAADAAAAEKLQNTLNPQAHYGIS